MQNQWSCTDELVVDILRLELQDSYECKFGKLSELPDSAYHTISGRLEAFDSIPI